MKKSDAKTEALGREPLVGGPILLREDGSLSKQGCDDEGSSGQSSPSPGCSGGVFSFSESESALPVDLTGSKPRARKEGSDGQSFSLASLFGGALECYLPESFEDVSVVRQIPDHQEVYVDKNTEMSFICELLGYESEVSNDAIGGYLFDDLAQCNEAYEKIIDRQGNLMATDKLNSVGKDKYRHRLDGRQVVTKLNQEGGTVADVVQVHLLVIRLPDVGTDVLLSLNYPLLGVTDVVGALELAESAANLTAPVQSILDEITSSFKINDWSLFA